MLWGFRCPSCWWQKRGHDPTMQASATLRILWMISSTAAWKMGSPALRFNLQAIASPSNSSASKQDSSFHIMGYHGLLPFKEWNLDKSITSVLQNCVTWCNMSTCITKMYQPCGNFETQIWLLWDHHNLLYNFLVIWFPHCCQAIKGTHLDAFDNFGIDSWDEPRTITREGQWAGFVGETVQEQRGWSNHFCT